VTVQHQRYRVVVVADADERVEDTLDVLALLLRSDPEEVRLLDAAAGDDVTRLVRRERVDIDAVRDDPDAIPVDDEQVLDLLGGRVRRADDEVGLPGGKECAPLVHDPVAPLVPLGEPQGCEIVDGRDEGGVARGRYGGAGCVHDVERSGHELRRRPAGLGPRLIQGVASERIGPPADWQLGHALGDLVTERVEEDDVVALTDLVESTTERPHVDPDCRRQALEQRLAVDAYSKVPALSRPAHVRSGTSRMCGANLRGGRSPGANRAPARPARCPAGAGWDRRPVAARTRSPTSIL